MTLNSMSTLRELRRQHGLSQRALAAHAGVGASTIHRIEKGVTTPRPYVARRLSAALGLMPTRVLEFSDDDFSPDGENQSHSVLVVDDDPTLGMTLAAALSQAGYHVRCVPSGEAALTAVTEQEPSLVLADVVMPGIDGHDLVGHLRKIGFEGPVVLMSAYGDLPLLPGVRFLAKPFTPPRLLAILADQLNHVPFGPMTVTPEL